MHDNVRTVIEQLRVAVSELEPWRLSGDLARELVEVFAEGERLCAAGKVLAVRQVEATGSWRRAGAFRDAAAYLASVSGTSVGHAGATVETARRLESLPDTESALRSGALSSAQAEAIAEAATADPGAERTLLRAAARDGLRGLRDQCARVKAAACDDELARETRIRAERSLRHWADPDGAGRIDIRGPMVEVGRIMSALAHERARFDAARADEMRERAAAYAFDALVMMADGADGSSVGADAPAPRYVGVIRVDFDALVRGRTAPGETCELAGSGPIALSEASRLLDDAFLKAVFVRGREVVLVSHPGRTIPAHLRTALEEIYPECAIEACGVRRHLEIDHNTPIEHGGVTALWNLGRLCQFHHRYKHQHHLRLAGKGTRKHFVTVDGLPPPGSGVEPSAQSLVTSGVHHQPREPGPPLNGPTMFAVIHPP
jgi:hypothetical protein